MGRSWKENSREKEYPRGTWRNPRGGLGQGHVEEPKGVDSAKGHVEEPKGVDSAKGHVEPPNGMEAPKEYVTAQDVVEPTMGLEPPTGVEATKGYMVALDGVEPPKGVEATKEYVTAQGKVKAVLNQSSEEQANKWAQEKEGVQAMPKLVKIGGDSDDEESPESEG